MISQQRRGVAIMGATGIGKTDLAIRLAVGFDGEIVSMDSRQVYRGLDIGTAKPTPRQRREVPHHLIDTMDPAEPYSAGRHIAAVEGALSDILERGRVPFLVGGTGLYFRVFFEGLANFGIDEATLRRVRRELVGIDTPALYRELESCDPERARRLAPRDRARITRALEVYRATGKAFSEHLRNQEPRPPWGGPRIVLTVSRGALRRRIATRTQAMFAAGWAEEVRALLRGGVAIDAPAMQSLGYGTIARVLNEGKAPEEAMAEVITLTQQYAKRQETFFRSIPEAVWVDVGSPAATSILERLIRAGLGL